MSYALYADEWPMQMIRLRLDRSDRHLFTELLSHCTRNLSDGVIDVPLALITDHPEAVAGVARLIEAGLVAEHPDGYLIADYTQHQRTKEQVDKDREKNRRYQEEYRERGRRHSEGDHRICTKGCKDSGKDLRKDLTKEVQSNPLLSDHKGGERGEGKGTSDETTGLAPVGLASVPDKGSHIFADADFTGYCLQCDLPKSNRLHQKVPARIEAAATAMFAAGASRIRLDAIWEDNGALYNVIASTNDSGGAIEMQWSTEGKDVVLSWLVLTSQTCAHIDSPAFAAVRVIGAELAELYGVRESDVSGSDDQTGLDLYSVDGADLTGHLPVVIAAHERIEAALASLPTTVPDDLEVSS